jgi:hypothetical protein
MPQQPGREDSLGNCADLCGSHLSFQLTANIHLSIGCDNASCLLPAQFFPKDPTQGESRDLDLSSMSFGQFVEFFFARKVVPDSGQYDYFGTGSDGEKYDES